jgi:homoserine dehydrogenase
MSGREWKIGVAGLGSVGAALVKALADHPGFAPGGDTSRVTGVSARDKAKDRGTDLSSAAWFDDPVTLALSPEVDVFVELIGGSEGPARAAVEAALEAGKPVVTANKALIACHGHALARLAEEKGVGLYYEAAVMGGVPAVKLVREGLLGEGVTRVAGILNGTCNFILSEMERTERSFGEVLAEAQRLGYAEADPTTDVGGFDAGHKIAILAALAFGGAPNMAAAEIDGIARVELLDIRLARDLGYRIKLIALAVQGAGGADVRVNPALVPLDHPLARAGGALNALFIGGERIGELYLQGPGAGGAPTAAAVVADLCDLAAGSRRPVFGAPARTLAPLAAVDRSRQLGKAFIRIMVRDVPGTIAAVSEALAKAGVSIDSFLQRSVQDTGHVPIVLITHAASDGAIKDALDHIAALSTVVEPPRMIRVAAI